MIFLSTLLKLPQSQPILGLIWQNTPQIKQDGIALGRFKTRIYTAVLAYCSNGPSLCGSDQKQLYRHVRLLGVTFSSDLSLYRSTTRHKHRGLVASAASTVPVKTL